MAAQYPGVWTKSPLRDGPRPVHKGDGLVWSGVFWIARKCDPQGLPSDDNSDWISCEAARAISPRGLAEKRAATVRAKAVKARRAARDKTKMSPNHRLKQQEWIARSEVRRAAK